MIVRPFLIVLIGWVPFAFAAAEEEWLWQQGRKLFYAAVTDKKQINPAIDMFRALARTYPQAEGRALTYIGALEALRGKHAFLPYDKYRKTLHGLSIMDQGLAKNPEDIEALFIHGMTCYYLPFFFKRHEDAKQKFKTILRLLPEAYPSYEREIVINVLNFIQANVPINEQEQQTVLKIKSAIVDDVSF